jgi:hypothetical protein
VSNLGLKSLPFHPSRYDPEIHWPLEKGYEDFRIGAAWPPEYETWNRAVQIRYENGRLVAANIEAAGIKLTRWNPVSYYYNKRFAATKIGQATPSSSRVNRH